MSKYRDYKKTYYQHIYKQHLIQIYKHIYPGGLPWEHSQTFPKQSIKRKLQLLLYSVPKRLKLELLKQLRKIKPLLLKIPKSLNIIRQYHLIYLTGDVEIGKWVIAHKKIRLLTKEQLKNLVRLKQSSLLGIYREKQKHYLKGNCVLCNNPLGHWYRNISEEEGVHYLCELSQENGALI